jgi:hypothetical protein
LLVRERVPEALLRLRYSRLVSLFYAKYLPFRDTLSIKFLASSPRPEARLAAKPERNRQSTAAADEQPSLIFLRAKLARYNFASQAAPHQPFALAGNCRLRAALRKI